MDQNNPLSELTHKRRLSADAALQLAALLLDQFGGLAARKLSQTARQDDLFPGEYPRFPLSVDKGDPVEHGIAQGYKISSAAETAQTAQQLPNGAAIRIVGVAIKKEHLANLLFQYLPREDKGIVTDL